MFKCKLRSQRACHSSLHPSCSLTLPPNNKPSVIKPWNLDLSLKLVSSQKQAQAFSFQIVQLLINILCTKCQTEKSFNIYSKQTKTKRGEGEKDRRRKRKKRRMRRMKCPSQIISRVPATHRYLVWGHNHGSIGIQDVEEARRAWHLMKIPGRPLDCHINGIRCSNKSLDLQE